VKINISCIKKSQIRNFINSPVFDNRSIIAYSDYWQAHASLMKLQLEEDSVEISGDSGFYVPENIRGRLYRKLLKAVRSPSIVINKILEFRYFFYAPRYMSWFDGFDATMSNEKITDPDLSPFRIDHRNLHNFSANILNTTREVEIHYSSWCSYAPSAQVIQAYYFRNLLIPFVEDENQINVLEIGSGSGNLASVIFNEYAPRVLFLVDLPESIVNAFVFLSSIYPDVPIFLPDQSENFLSKFNPYGGNDESAIVFLTPWQVDFLPSDAIDLAINTHSFQEMKQEQIKDYFSLIQRVVRNEGLFFCVNRVEKIPCTGNSYEEVQYEPPNRFYEYPWNPKNLRLIDEVSRIHRICASDAAAIRLEKVVKNK
jgi:putative sugar O-methyltransferase